MKGHKKSLQIMAGVLILCLIFSLCSCNTANENAGADLTASTESQNHTQSIVSSLVSQNSGDKSSPTSAKNKKSSTPKNTADKELDFGLTSKKLSYVLPQNYYYAARLTGKNLTAYKTLKNAVATRTVGKISMGKISEKQLRLIYTAVRDDYPEYFWIPSHYSYSVDDSGNITLIIESDFDKEGYTVSAKERNEMAEKFKKVIATIKSDLEKITAKDGATIYDFEEYILNWLCKNVEYTETDKTDLIYTAYGALVNGKAVCEGYARAASLMFNLVGIENGLVNGKGNDGIGHLWNIVKIGNNWYHFDPTWSDDEDHPNDPYPFYYNLSDDEITRDRTINANLKTDYSNVQDNFNFNLPKCTKSGKTYSSPNLLILNQDSNYSEQIISALGTYLYENNDNPKAFFDVMIQKDIDTQTAVNIYKQISFKQVVSTINIKYLRQSKTKIKSYIISASENGGFRIYLTY